MSRRRRTVPPVVLALLLASAMAVILTLVALVAARAGVLTPTDEAPLGVGPVMVLGGGIERLEAALRSPAVEVEGRLLVVSAGAIDDLPAFGRDCAEPDVRCVVPVPLTTRGEARTAARLATAEAWPALTVVTSDWHAQRVRAHFAACLDIPVAVVAVAYLPAEALPRGLVWREALGLLDARLRPAC